MNWEWTEQTIDVETMKWETMNWRKKQEKTKRWKHQNRDKEFGPWPKVNKKFGNDEMKKTTIKLNNGKALRGVTKLGTNLSNNGRSKRGTLELGMNWTNNWCGNNEMGNDELEKETRKN